MKKTNAFTLIELLVVISIVGLLASLILASLNGAKENARIAALKEFSSSIKHTLYGNIVADFNFDGTYRDSTGNFQSAISGSFAFEDSTINGKSLRMYNGGALIFTSLSGSAYGFFNKAFPSGNFTFDGWIKTPSLSDSHPYIFSSLDCNGLGLLFDANANNLQFSSGGGAVCLSIPKSTFGQYFFDNKWNHMAFSYRASDGFIKIYMNGQKIYASTNAACGTGSLFRNCSTTIGTNFTMSYPSNQELTVDEVRLYDAYISD